MSPFARDDEYIASDGFDRAIVLPIICHIRNSLGNACSVDQSALERLPAG